MFWRNVLVVGGLISVLALGWVTLPAGAQENVDLQQLLQTVQELQKQVAEVDVLKARVKELEARLGEEEGGTPAVATVAEEKTLTARVEKLEKQAEAEDETGLRASWQDGLHIASGDDAFQMDIGGRILFDMSWFDDPKYWELGGSRVREESGVDFRRLRMNLQGTLYENYIYRLEVDFADSDVDLKDAYVGMKNIPYVGTVKVGQFVEPFGLENMTTSNNITFMERSLVNEALATDRTPGVGVETAFLNNRLTLAAGAFNKWYDEKQHWHYTTRVTGLPWYAEEGRRLLHLGAAYSYLKPDSEVYFRTPPEADMGNYHMNTGNFPADKIEKFGLEAALVYGPFSLQGEYMAAEFDLSAPHRDFTLFPVDHHFTHAHRFDGYYVQASYFLTGEHRPYDCEKGFFGRLVPKKNFSLRNGGWGAWELALRYSTLDLTSENMRSGVAGGDEDNITVGVNWYLTPNTRVMMNYVRADIDQSAYEGSLDIYQGRFQIDF